MSFTLNLDVEWTGVELNREILLRLTNRSHVTFPDNLPKPNKEWGHTGKLSPLWPLDRNNFRAGESHVLLLIGTNAKQGKQAVEFLRSRECWCTDINSTWQLHPGGGLCEPARQSVKGNKNDIPLDRVSIQNNLHIDCWLLLTNTTVNAGYDSCNRRKRTLLAHVN